MVAFIIHARPRRTDCVRGVIFCYLIVLALFIKSTTPLNDNPPTTSDRQLSKVKTINTNDDATFRHGSEMYIRQKRQMLEDSTIQSNDNEINSNVFERQYNPQPETRQGSTTTTTTSTTNCTLNANGFFGQPTGQVYEIQYIYQTTVTTGTSSTEILNIIAPALDIAIPNATIPYLFPQCNNKNDNNQTTTRTRLLLRNRRLQTTTQAVSTINAISSQPEDQFIISGLSCTGNIADGDCYIAQGYITILGSNFMTSQSVEAIVLPIIQYSIQNLATASNIPNVVNIQYLDNNRTTVAPITAPPIPGPTSIVTNAPIAPIPTRPTPILSRQPALSPRSFVPFTFAPINSLPTGPPILPTPVLIPQPTVSSAPAPVTPIIPTTSAPVTPTAANNTAAPTNENSTTERAVKAKGLDWWAYLIIGVGAALLLLICFTTIQSRRNRHRLPDPNKRSAEIQIRKDNNVNQPVDPDDAYEPPPTGLGTATINNYEPPGGSSVVDSDGDAYIPPGLGFNLTSSDLMVDNTLTSTQQQSVNPTMDITLNDEEDDEGDDQNGDDTFFDEEGDEDETGDANEQDGDEEFVEAEGEEVEDETYNEEEEEDVTYDEDVDEEDVEYVEGEEVTENQEVTENFEEESYYDDGHYEVDESQTSWGKQNNAFGGNFS